jgi:hypothetical protein
VSIQVFEINAKPRGVTFTHFLPRLVAKVLPALVTLLVGLTALWVARSESHRNRALFAISGPFAILLMGLAACYGTISYEYHTVTLLGLLPGLVVWVEREPVVTRSLKLLTCVVFAALLCVAFRTFQFGTEFDSKWMTQAYAAFCAVFLGLCMYILLGPLKAENGPMAPAAL